MGLSELKADAQLVIDRIVKTPASDLDLKAELVDNVIPLMIGVMEAIQQGVEAEVADLADAVDEIIDQTGDVLHPETAAKIVAVMEVGILLANELEAVMKNGKLDDVAKKRVKATIHAYRQTAKIVGEMVTEITLVDVDEDEDPEQPQPGQPRANAFIQGDPDPLDPDDNEDGAIEGGG